MSTKYTTFFLVFFFFIQQMALAQDCTLKGFLQDENALPVINASITLLDNKNEVVDFTQTNIEGVFTIKAPCSENYNVEVKHLNYETKLEKLDLSKNISLKLILKTREQTNLQEVIINVKQPIKIKGDTIEYDADSFKIGNEEVLEDVIKKLPGIVVENGKIYHQGKEIKTITVGGREVLGGNIKLLNKNLPSDTVDKVQLNKKFKINPFSSSLQEDEQFSLNIELKDDKKSLVFGNANIGGGTSEHTNLQSKNFYFAPKTDATLIVDYNTYGKQVFDQEDYSSFFGLYSDFNAEGSIYSLRRSNIDFRLPYQNKPKQINSFTGATHFGYEPSKRMTISGFGIVNTNNIRNHSITEIFYNAVDRHEKYETEGKQFLMSASGRILLDYSPNSRGQFKYRLNFNHTQNKGEEGIVNYRKNMLFDNRNNNNERVNNSISQNISYIHKVGRDHNIGFYFRYQYQEEKPKLQIYSSNPMLYYIYGDNVNSLNEILKTKVNSIQLYSVYNHLLNNTTNLKIKIGTNFSSQTMDNKTFANDILYASNEFSGLYDFNFEQHYLDATLTKKIGKFKMDVGAGFHNLYQNIYTNAEKLNEIKDNRFFPHIQFKYNLNIGQSIHLNYHKSYSYPSIRDMSNAKILSEYNSIFVGNPNLIAMKTHSSNLNYRHFNPFYFITFYANLSYVVRENPIQTISEYFNMGTNSNIEQQNHLRNINKNTKIYTANFYLDKRFSKIYQIKVQVNGNYINYFTFINNNLSNSRNISQNYSLDNIFTFKKKFELSVGLKLNLSKHKANFKQNFNTWQPNTSFAWSLGKILIKSDFNYHLQYIDGKQMNIAKQWDASVRYNFIKKTSLSFVAGNILANNVLISNSFDSNISRTTVTNVLGRYFLLNLRYKF